LRSSLEHVDQTNRATMDGVALRQGQGAAQALAESIGALQGKSSQASARPEAKT